ncbi:MAG: DUF4906 domain-containing protein [Bacteroidales bacterium]|nr:DUF4906 domain-containing protein [Bacteroidales bacterium]
MRRRILFLLSAVMAIVSCTRENLTDGICFSVKAEKPWRDTATKSLLTAPDIENRISCVSIGVYCGGSLLQSVHFTSDSGNLKLDNMERYTVYALANMGDMSGEFPQSESDLPGISYRIHSYDEINRCGIPMAGRADFYGNGNTLLDIGLDRLFAKVRANLNVEWPGGTIVQGIIGNLNATLRPFGKSSIQGPADLFSNDIERATPSGQASLVFYVPENLCGTIPGISSADERSPDHMAEVLAKKDRLTYLEVEVQGNGLYTGVMKYRSYLGNNTADNFDIERDSEYVLNICYSENNVSKSEWKYDSSEIVDHRAIDVESPIFVFPGCDISLSHYVQTNMPLSTIGWSLTMKDGSLMDNFIESTGQTVSLEGVSFTVGDGLYHSYSNGRLTVAPLKNPLPELTSRVKVYVADREISWKNTVWGQVHNMQTGENAQGSKILVFPGRKADADVDYTLYYYDEDDSAFLKTSRKQKGGSEWNWTTDPANGISCTYIGDTGREYEQIRISAQSGVLPGDYPVTAWINDDCLDNAYLHVNDTRFLKWINRSSVTPPAGKVFPDYRYLSDNKILLFMPEGCGYSIPGGDVYTRDNSPLLFVAGDRSVVNYRGKGVCFEGGPLYAGNYSGKIGFSYSQGITTSSVEQYSVKGNDVSGQLILIPEITSALTSSNSYSITVFSRNGYDDATKHSIEAIIMVGNGVKSELVLTPAISKVLVGASVTLTPNLYTFLVRSGRVSLRSSTELDPTDSSLTWSGAKNGVFRALSPGNYRVSCSYMGSSIAYADIEVTDSDIDVSGNWDQSDPTILH